MSFENSSVSGDYGCCAAKYCAQHFAQMRIRNIKMLTRKATMNLILEQTDQVRFFTNMREVIAALGISCSDYDWYVSDIETNGFQFADGWHPGSELESLIASEDIQFIWAVFSAFPKGVRVDVGKAPCVDGNPHYWDGSEPGPQLDGASFEIACWDSSATILVGLDAEKAGSYRSTFSDAVDLKSAARK
jgi:hypothetical protein